MSAILADSFFRFPARDHAGVRNPREHPGAANTREPAPPVKNPGAGRTTPLGRRTERPARDQAPGPSGQKQDAQRQKHHTNK
jgi:hypothetical protein